MKIAMIGSRGLGSNYGGIERCLDELCPRLAALGHSVDVFSQVAAPAGLPDGLRSIHVPTIGGKHFANLSRSAIATLLAARRYDVVHFHATGPGILTCLTSPIGQASVVTVHALDQQRQKWGWAARHALSLAQSTVMSFADEVTVVSESLRRYVRARYDKPAECLPNGMARMTPRDPGPLLERHGLRARGYLLFASRLTPEKGCHDLIEAFNRSRTPLRLAIAGGHGDSSYLARLRVQANPDRVRFLGHLQGAELAEAFSNAHTFVLPSYVEGMSIALLEAIAYRLPVLVSDIPENRLVVGDLPATFPVGDVDTLRRAIDTCTDGPDRRRNSRVPLERFHSWDAIAAGYERVYLRAVHRHADVGYADA